MTDHVFPYRFDRRWAALFVVLGVTRTDGVTIRADGSVLATYGWFRMETTIDNIDHTLVTGPHRWYTAVGLRLSFADSGLTFGTNHERGLCLAFVEPVHRVIGMRDHSALWVSVADPDGLEAALRRDPEEHRYPRRHA
ncbi:MAG: hypothetical protein ABIP17_01720 [Ilumatobacteraceae bacterium]